MMQIRRFAVLAATVTSLACRGDVVTSPFGGASPHPDLTTRFAFIQYPNIDNRFCTASTCIYRLGTAELSGNNRVYVSQSSIGNEAQPALSPDGAMFAITSRASNGNLQIELMDLAGPRRTLVGPPLMSSARYGLFSRDGRTVYFNGVQLAGAPNYIWRIGVDGTGLAKVADVPVRLYNSYDYRTGGAASRDGRKIACADSVSGAIKVLDVGTGRIVTVANGAAGIAPEFSPEASGSHFSD